MDGLDFIREKVRERDGWTCQNCFRVWSGGRRFDVHHLDEKQESIKDYGYDKQNPHKMITLCHKCHMGLHSVRLKMKNADRKKLFANKSGMEIVILQRGKNKTLDIYFPFKNYKTISGKCVWCGKKARRIDLWCCSATCARKFVLFHKS